MIDRILSKMFEELVKFIKSSAGRHLIVSGARQLGREYDAFKERYATTYSRVEKETAEGKILLERFSEVRTVTPVNEISNSTVIQGESIKVVIYNNFSYSIKVDDAQQFEEVIRQLDELYHKMPMLQMSQQEIDNSLRTLNIYVSTSDELISRKNSMLKKRPLAESEGENQQ